MIWEYAPHSQSLNNREFRKNKNHNETSNQLITYHEIIQNISANIGNPVIHNPFLRFGDGRPGAKVYDDQRRYV